MGGSAFRTEYTLDGKPDQDRVKLNAAFVMSITDETAFLPAGAFDAVKLQAICHPVIIILGKIIAFFENNCYHILVSAQGSYFGSSVVWKRQDDFGWVVACLFSMRYPSSHGYKTMITQKASVSNNLTG